MKHPGKGLKAHTKSAEAQGGLRYRKSGNGAIGLPKKGGHGGKFTWSGNNEIVTDVDNAATPVDTKDPNFEDPVDELVVLTN